jgi:hypothetical protein
VDIDEGDRGGRRQDDFSLARISFDNLLRSLCSREAASGLLPPIDHEFRQPYQRSACVCARQRR